MDPAAEEQSSAPPRVSSKEEADAFDRDATLLAMNLGWLGKFFGSAGSAPTNIAGVVLVVCFAAWMGSYFVAATADLSDFRKSMKDIVSLVLGFLLGAATKR